jgi:xanthine dehydrogenase YagR molybdenum-binding subunit
MPTVQEIPTASPIGRDTPRIDGPLKVSGTAHYASDFYFPGLLYGVPVEATIAKGKITKLDTAAAEKLPGARFCIVKTSGRFSVRLSGKA